MLFVLTSLTSSGESTADWRDSPIHSLIIIIIIIIIIFALPRRQRKKFVPKAGTLPYLMVFVKSTF